MDFVPTAVLNHLISRIIKQLILSYVS
uniref:Uncharacterized protein n=1 Tax=Anguilla anguilla TaxID=7936 RepID=A0A0E9S944_ANGAN